MIIKQKSLALLFLPLLFLLTSCGPIGDKSASMLVIYGVTAISSLLLLIAYCCLVQKKNLWYLLLYTSVFVTNIGYYALGSSQTLGEALLANRISYLGSVFLPLSMLMIIMGLTKLRISRRFTAVLLGISAIVFMIASSPPYLDIYYSQVSLETINGVSVLNKVYGPLHCIYLFYLLSYFGTMIAVILHACLKKKISSSLHAVILAMVVFINIGVWLLEQLVRIDFELLSMSYIISEVFLLGLYLMIQERQKAASAEAASPLSEKETDIPDIALTEEEVSQKDENSAQTEDSHLIQNQTDHNNEQKLSLLQNLSNLTPTERRIYELYLAGYTTKDVLSEMNIKENTLKYHNRNIYSKLGVSSRRELLHIASFLNDNAQS